MSNTVVPMAHLINTGTSCFDACGDPVLVRTGPGVAHPCQRDQVVGLDRCTATIVRVAKSSPSVR